MNGITLIQGGFKRLDPKQGKMEGYNMPQGMLERLGPF